MKSDVETIVCLRPKQIAPAISIRTALIAVSEVDVLDSLRLPTSPRLKIRRSAPKIIPLIPASDNARLRASE